MDTDSMPNPTPPGTSATPTSQQGNPAPRSPQAKCQPSDGHSPDSQHGKILLPRESPTGQTHKRASTHQRPRNPARASRGKTGICGCSDSPFVSQAPTGLLRPWRIKYWQPAPRRQVVTPGMFQNAVLPSDTAKLGGELLGTRHWATVALGNADSPSSSGSHSSGTPTLP